MKFAYSDISGVFDFNQPFVHSLVIENQLLFRKLIKDIYLSLDGIPTSVILSKDNRPIDISKNLEIITDFVNFSINQKTLLNKICSALEHISVSAENYLETQKLLLEIENKVSLWSFEFPCDIVASKITISNLLKSIGIELNDDYQGENGDAEKIIDYMELVREFDREKLFITVNMRCYFSNTVMESFINTVVSHEYKVLMLESKSYPLLNLEKRLTIDEDLCEF